MAYQPCAIPENFRVNFMIIGAMKSGTTSLASHLAQHPEICFCREKEPMYFIHADWKRNLKKYHELYSPSKNQICGEASTPYTTLPEFPFTAPNLFDYNPELKLIYIMRQPIDRIVSHYAHDFLMGRTKDPIEITILNNPKYINISCYGAQIKPYMELFRSRNILLLTFEEYISQPFKTLKKVFEFLNVAEEISWEIDTSPKNKSVGMFRKKRWAYKLYQINARIRISRVLPSFIRQRVLFWTNYRLDYKPALSKSTRKLLWRFLENDVEIIEQILNRQLKEWQEPSLD